MKNRVLGIGNALVDALVQVQDEALLTEMNLPKGSMQLIDTEGYEAVCRRLSQMQVKRATGGSAANTVLALSHLGAQPGIIGRVSEDDNGHFFADNCKRVGIETFLLPSELPTGVASTFITPDGQRTFATYLGAAATLHADDLRPEWLEGYAYLYIEGYLVQDHDLICRAVEMAHAAGLKVCLDLASYNIVEAQHEFFSYLLDHTDIVFANEEEALAFTGKGPREALDLLAQRCEVAVVKTGKEGAMARRGEEFAQAPAEPVAQVVDTTAAGDFFAAGFLYRHAQGAPLADCLVAGGAVAGAVIQVVGTQLADQTWDALRQRLGVE
jgi:sugar/nucleoside kinase (ribokinase family)